MKKVLVIEDDMLLSQIMAMSLGAAGFEARAANDGFQGELEIKTWRPDAVLLDLIMPGEDGFGVLRTIRADSEVSKTFFIVLSNLSAAETIAEVKKFGVTDYLIKAEVTPDVVVEKLKVALA